MSARQLLSRATEGTAAPTPGYLYKDLAQAATSNPAACQEMAQYLTNRLSSKNNPNIKFKCLKVIAKLCDQVPRNQFRRCMSQHPQAVGAVKESLNFRGPLDAVRGDEPNAKVRQAAQEALDAVYREASSSEVAAASGGGGGYGGSSMGGASPSYGQSPYGQGGGGGYGGPSGGGGGGPRRMDGMGNPRYTDPRLDPRWNNGQGGQPANLQEAIKEAGEVVLGMIKDPLAKNVEATASVPRQGHGELPGYGAPQQQYGGRQPPGAAELSRQTNGQWTMASNRGPGAVQAPQAVYARESQEYYKARDTSYDWSHQQNSATPTRPTSGGVGGSWGTASAPSAASHSTTPSIHITQNPNAPPPHHQPSGAAGRPVSDGSYERQLVLELCPPGGMKAVPPPDKLANFTKVVPSLNSDLVCPVLLDCLEEGQPWIIRAKALCVMETCLVGGARADGTNPYCDFFFACADEVMPLAAHSRSAIHDPAKRVLALLGVDLPPGYAASGGAAAPPVAAPAPNLLDFDGDVPAVTPAPTAPAPPPSEAPPPPPSPAAGPAAPTSMFGGMTVKSGAAPATAAAAVAPAPTSGNLLDNFSPSQQQAAPTAAAAPNNDIFRDAGVKMNGSGAAAPVSMFDQMNLKDNEDKKTDSEDAGDLSSLAVPALGGGGGGSAFGFINATTSKEGSVEGGSAAGGSGSAADQQQQQHPPAPSAESFDPLKNFSPNTAQKKMMQISPEQMQAMAYQQMMMQQQMQHQMQLQRAYAGAGGVPGAVPGGMPMPGGMMPMQMPMQMPHGGGGGGGSMQQLSMGPNVNMSARPVKKDDKKFDFVKDAMHTANKK